MRLRVEPWMRDVADILGSLDDAETAAERRREQQRPRAGRPTFHPDYKHPARLYEQKRSASAGEAWVEIAAGAP
jgi:hypothetical protein